MMYLFCCVDVASNKTSSSYPTIDEVVDLLTTTRDIRLVVCGDRASTYYKQQGLLFIEWVSLVGLLQSPELFEDSIRDEIESGLRAAEYAFAAWITDHFSSGGYCPGDQDEVRTNVRNFATWVLSLD